MITLTKGRFDCFISGKYLSYGEAEVANPSGPHPGDLDGGPNHVVGIVPRPRFKLRTVSISCNYHWGISSAPSPPLPPSCNATTHFLELGDITKEHVRYCMRICKAVGPQPWTNQYSVVE